MHTRKRPFQPPIDSIFARRSPAPPPPHPRAPPSSTPALPASIQASLLAVGMRVRKAVPEGYKTRPRSPPADATAPSTAAAAPRRRAELAPFCALLRVGGWAAQEEEEPVAGGGDRRPAEEVCAPEWFSSRESEGSVVAAGAAGAPRKRTRSGSEGGGDWEAEEEGEGEEDRVAEVVMEGAGRRFARPRTRRRPGDALDGAADTPRNSLDWEEAPFLEPWDAEMHGT